MPEIYLPQKIVFEKNALTRFSSGNAEKILIVCDSEILLNRGTVELIKNRCLQRSSDVQTVFDINPEALYGKASEAFFSNEADLIIAVGTAGAIDCGMLLSHESGAEFTAIPCCCASSMTDFENNDYYSYRHSPSTLILDPKLIEYIPSSAVAYDALAALAYAIDTLVITENIITKSLAIHAATGIFKSIIPACRGDIPSLEKLMYSMYFAVASHRNSKEIEKSYLSRVSRFFADFGYPRASVCALILPNIIEYEETAIRNGLFEIAQAVGITRDDDDPSFATIRLIDEIRKIQAQLGIPRSVSGFNLTEAAYHSRRIHSDIPDDILDLCYYGSFRFMKL